MTNLRRITALLLLCAALAYSQSAIFPSAIATDTDLLVAKNRAQTTLVGALNSSATTFTLASDAFAVNVPVTIGSEIILILAKTGATVTSCTRGYDSTAAASHTTGALVSAYIVARNHNQGRAEIEAIETFLGVNGANIAIPNPLPINKGGTNAQTQSAALTSILGASTVPVANGGTNAATAGAARTNLAAAGLADANTFTALNTFGSATGANIPGADAPYTAPSVMTVRAGTSASPNTTATPGFVFQMANAEPSNIAQGAVFDCYSTSAARYGFSGGCITTTNVLHDLTIAKGGVANRNLVYADAPPAISVVLSAVNAAGTITVTTVTAHYASTGEAVIIAGTAGMAGLNATVASVTVTSATTFTFACGGCGAGPAGAGGSVTVPTVYYGSWDSIFKVSGPQLRIVGHESDMNNQYADAGDNVSTQDATFNYALYCSSHNCTTGMYMNSGDATGKYYFPLKFGSNALVAGYPYIDSSTGPNTVDFAWIGNGQPLRWLDSLGGRWPLLFLSTGDSTFLSAPTGGVINIGPNVTNVVDVSATVVSNRQSTVLAKTPNYIASETGANNAIAGALVDALGVAVPLVSGLRVTVKLGHTLQAGANTFNLNAGGAVNIKSSRNPANNIGTAYAATGNVTLGYDSTGPYWVDINQ